MSFGFSLHTKVLLIVQNPKYCGCSGKIAGDIKDDRIPVRIKTEIINVKYESLILFNKFPSIPISSITSNWCIDKNYKLFIKHIINLGVKMKLNKINVLYAPFCGSASLEKWVHTVCEIICGTGTILFVPIDPEPLSYNNKCSSFISINDILPDLKTAYHKYPLLKTDCKTALIFIWPTQQNPEEDINYIKIIKPDLWFCVTDVTGGAGSEKINKFIMDKCIINFEKVLIDLNPDTFTDEIITTQDITNYKGIIGSIIVDPSNNGLEINAYTQILFEKCKENTKLNIFTKLIKIESLNPIFFKLGLRPSTNWLNWISNNRNHPNCTEIIKLYKNLLNSYLKIKTDSKEIESINALIKIINFIC